MALTTSKKAKQPRPRQVPKAKTKKRTPEESQTWWEEQVEAPREGLPDTERLSKRQSRYRLVVWACIIGFPVAVLVNFAQFATDTPEAQQVVSSEQQYADTRGEATIAVRRWLASDPAPLPGGVLISWDRATTEKYTPTEQDSVAAYQIQTHYLTVAAPDGTAYATTVTLGVDAEHGAVPLTSPTLLPEPPVDTTFRPAPYPGSILVNPGEAVPTAIDQWVSAYTSGDPAILRAYVGDPDEGHSYVPLVGASLSEISIGDAYAVGAVGEDENPATIFVSISARISWSNDPVSDEEKNDLAEVSFDLLITGNDTAAPKIVAWGGPGTGPGLEEYQNAITGRQIEAPTPGEDVEDPLTDPDAQDTP